MAPLVLSILREAGEPLTAYDIYRRVLARCGGKYDRHVVERRVFSALRLWKRRGAIASLDNKYAAIH